MALVSTALRMGDIKYLILTLEICMVIVIVKVPGFVGNTIYA